MTQEEFREEALRVRPQLLQVARRYLGDDDDAQDVVQDALLRLWQMVGDIRLPMAPLASRLTRNLCIDRLRRQRSFLAIPAAETLAYSHSGGAADGSPASSDPRLDRMLAIIETLPSLQQTILRLRHIEGMEMKDIAELIGTNEVAIRKALSRARQAVRTQYMKRYER
jgi:RNA polymerase sigma-70 factor (ECF subfamily)